MSTDFPTSLDTLTNPTANDRVDTVSHADQHANANDAIEALQAKVGANSSAVQTSHDYKLGQVTGADRAVGVSATQTLTNKTLTSPAINTPTIATPTIADPVVTNGTFDNPTLTGGVKIDLGSDATGDMYYRDASGNFVRLPVGADGRIIQAAGGLPTWAPLPSSGVSSETTAGTTHSLTTTAGQKVVVWAKGNFTGQSSGVTISLQYNGVTKDSVDAENGTNSYDTPFALMYTETPGAATANITVTISGGGSLQNVDILVLKFS